MCNLALSDALTVAGWTVELHKTLFAGETPDHEWITPVATHSPAIITSDKKMKLFATEGGLARAAIESGMAKVFFVRGAGLTPEEQAHAIILARHRICRLFKKHAGTYLLARIHTKGSRIGEVQLLDCGGASATECKYGTGIA
jgi:hypothetical protein